MTPDAPLAGVRVLDLTRVLAGPFCTLLLADLGAEVVKLEPPGEGDPARGNGPFVGPWSTYFVSLNRGKRSLVADLTHPEGQELALALARRAHVLVENFRPGVLERLGLAPERLLAENPTLVVARISGFGQTGPYRDRPAYDVIVQGMAGTLSLTGTPEGPPVRVGFSIGDLGAGMFAALAILAALRRAEHTGMGEVLDVPMLDCQVALLENAFARYLSTGEVPRRLGSRHPVIAPFQAFAAADGELVIACSTDRQFAALAEVLGHPEWTRDPRFADRSSRSAHAEELAAAMAAVLAGQPRQEWLSRLVAAGVPAGPVHTVAEAAQDPSLLAAGLFRRLSQPGAPPMGVVGHPVRFAGSRLPQPSPAPSLDADREEVLRRWLS